MEIKRDMLNTRVENYGLTDYWTIAAAEEIHKDINRETRKNIIKAQQKEIKRLQNRISALSEIAVMLYEVGENLGDTIKYVNSLK